MSDSDTDFSSSNSLKGDNADEVMSRLRGQNNVPESVQADSQRTPLVYNPKYIKDPSSYTQGEMGIAAARNNAAQSAINRINERASQDEQILQNIERDREKVPQAPKAPVTLPPPTYVQKTPIQAFGSFASTLAVFAGLLTRRPLVTALEASAAAMNALRQNDQATFNQKYAQWQAETKNALDTWKAKNEQYKEILEGVKFDRDTQIGLLRAHAAANQHDLALAELQMNGIEGFQKIQQRANDAAMKVNLAQEHIAMEYERANYSLNARGTNVGAQVLRAYNQDWDQKHPGVPPPPELVAAWVRSSRVGEYSKVAEADMLVFDTDKALSLLTNLHDSFLTGFAGKGQNVLDFLTNSKNPEASKFIATLNRIEEEYGKVMRGGTSNAAASRIATIITGLKSATTEQMAIENLKDLKDVMTFYKKDLLEGMTPKSSNEDWTKATSLLQNMTPNQVVQNAVLASVDELPMGAQEMSAFVHTLNRESGLDPNVQDNPHDGVNIPQILPETARSLGFGNEELLRSRTPEGIDYSIRAGAKYFHKLWLQFDGNVSEVESHYNTGARGKRG